MMPIALKRALFRQSSRSRGNAGGGGRLRAEPLIGWWRVEMSHVTDLSRRRGVGQGWKSV